MYARLTGLMAKQQSSPQCQLPLQPNEEVYGSRSLDFMNQALLTRTCDFAPHTSIAEPELLENRQGLGPGKESQSYWKWDIHHIPDTGSQDMKLYPDMFRDVPTCQHIHGRRPSWLDRQLRAGACGVFLNFNFLRKLRLRLVPTSRI